MLERERVAALFADAWALYADAIEILESGKQRIAEEVAWGATKRATDALILARTGREPTGTGQTSGWMRVSRELAPATLYCGCDSKEGGTLHANCFYLNNCPLPDLLELLIRETNSYIRQAEIMAEA